MTVFLSHAPADSEAAEALERYLERRGHFVEMDNGETALRPVQAADVVVALISKDFMFSPMRLRHEQRALDAWAEGRLILVKLDKHFAPVGLRDLDSIDASFEARREFTWGEVLTQIQGSLRASAGRGGGEGAVATGAPGAMKRAPSPQAPARAKKNGGGFGALALLLVVVAGVGALAVSGAIWLTQRIGPSPGTLAELIEGVDAFGVRFGLPAGVTPGAFAIAIAAMLAALVLMVMRLARRPARAPRREAPAAMDEVVEGPEAAPQATGDSIFVSYARANAQIVTPVFDEVKRSGRKVWMDKDGVRAGEGWAGEIVRAIKGAQDVLVMCSNAAFESDHVKREIYLADRYKKRLLPVFIEDAQPPEDFEYFFAGVQWLKLHESPEAERPALLLRALGNA